MRSPRSFRTVRQCYAHTCRRPIGYDTAHRIWTHLDKAEQADPAWRGHMPDPQFVHALSLGDHFRFFDGTNTVYGPVLSADSDYMLQGTRVRLAGGVELDRHAWSCVEITRDAPRCPCDRTYDRCEEDCAWPEEIEALWASGA
ncbi:hypothetical protein ABT127_39135 [Streptomyces sp. NPDC001904]|uniref:hypothetical protein n=1 Tax=Streptomyces sp. NPDC001904 TaxID=3154531 RepID=UPI00332236FC